MINFKAYVFYANKAPFLYCFIYFFNNKMRIVYLTLFETLVYFVSDQSNWSIRFGLGLRYMHNINVNVTINFIQLFTLFIKIKSSLHI